MLRMLIVRAERLQGHLIPWYFVIPDAAEPAAKQCGDGRTQFLLLKIWPVLHSLKLPQTPGL